MSQEKGVTGKQCHSVARHNLKLNVALSSVLLSWVSSWASALIVLAFSMCLHFH